MGSTGTVLAGAGSLLGGAASIASVIAGKNAQQENTRALRQLTDLSTTGAEGILSQTAPLRSATALSLFDTLTGGRNENLRVFAPEREAVESQFGRARESIIATTPARGGQLNRALADVEVARAQSVSGLETDVRKRAFEDALRIGFQVAPSTVFSTFQGATGTLASLAGQGAELQAAGGAGLGQVAAVGALLAMKQGKK
ncbi:MAG: hypothetical protein A3E78_08220 [Alphaproteobacteria bacterium RIFCSPHIGHO2_12_FULL_63_12]|nr:MAG: hypothetical protein A3E78_08220 [Alphaproteobacteria bacterium RIFCSPHIGHO2_12_FULL_63_12]